MGDPPRPRPPGQPPITIPPGMAARDSILKRAHEVAQVHVSREEVEEKQISSNWKDFFDEKRSVHVPSRRCTFNVYVAGPRKPTAAEDHKTPVIFCIHGGGYSGLSFALVAEELRDEYVPGLRCVGPTLRTQRCAKTPGAWERHSFLPRSCREIKGTKIPLLPQASSRMLGVCCVPSGARGMTESQRLQ